jgi:hypothetical protein
VSSTAAAAVAAASVRVCADVVVRVREYVRLLRTDCRRIALGPRNNRRRRRARGSIQRPPVRTSIGVRVVVVVVVVVPVCDREPRRVFVRPPPARQSRSSGPRVRVRVRARVGQRAEGTLRAGVVGTVATTCLNRVRDRVRRRVENAPSKRNKNNM